MNCFPVLQFGLCPLCPSDKRRFHAKAVSTIDVVFIVVVAAFHRVFCVYICLWPFSHKLDDCQLHVPLTNADFTLKRYRRSMWFSSLLLRLFIECFLFMSACDLSPINWMTASCHYPVFPVSMLPTCANTNKLQYIGFCHCQSIASPPASSDFFIFFKIQLQLQVR